MKTKIKFRILAGAMIAMSFILLSSFTDHPGGDSFSIYLNDKLLVQQYVHLKEKPKSISLIHATANDVIRVHYSHCGKIGLTRSLLFQDEKKAIVKNWKFKNTENGDKGDMTIRALEVASLQKSQAGKIMSLVYISQELPQGIVLATVNDNATLKASME